MKHKYVLQAIVERPEFSKAIAPAGLGESITRPSSSRASKLPATMARTASSKKKKSLAQPVIEEKSTSQLNEPVWHLRILSTDTSSMIVQKDTEKEDRYKLTKESWEAGQPGRATRAQDIREMYVKSVESTSIQPIFLPAKESIESSYKPWSIVASRPSSAISAAAQSEKKSAIAVIDDEAWTVMQQERDNAVKGQMSIFSEIKTTRKAEKEKRISRTILRDLLEKQAAEIEELQKTDQSRRNDYRIRVLRELEEDAKALEAAKAAELAAAGLTDDAGDKDKKKKAGKK